MARGATHPHLCPVVAIWALAAVVDFGSRTSAPRNPGSRDGGKSDETQRTSKPLSEQIDPRRTSRNQGHKSGETPCTTQGTIRASNVTKAGTNGTKAGSMAGTYRTQTGPKEARSLHQEARIHLPKREDRPRCSNAEVQTSQTGAHSAVCNGASRSAALPPQSLPHEDQCTQKISVMEILRDARMVVWPKEAQTKLRLFCVRPCCRCFKPFMVRVVDEVILVSLVSCFSWSLSNVEVHQ